MKKKILLAVFLLFAVVLYSQEAFNRRYNGLRKDLKIKDDTAVILEFEKTKYLVFQKGNVYKYILSVDNDILYKEKLEKEAAINSYTILDTLFGINPKQLKENIKMQMHDAISYKLKLYTKEKEINYSYKATDIFDEERLPDYKKQMACLKVVEFLRNIFYDERYKRVQEADTLYIVWDDAIYEIDDKYQACFSKKSRVPYLLFIPTNAHPQWTSKSFLQKNKQSVVDMTFFQRYGYFASTKALRNKKLFIIDPEEILGNKLKSSSVRFVPLYTKDW